MSLEIFLCPSSIIPDRLTVGEMGSKRGLVKPIVSFLCQHVILCHQAASQKWIHHGVGQEPLGIHDGMNFIVAE